MELNDININTTLTVEQQTTTLSALGMIEDSVPWLISLAPATRKRLVKLGPKSERFVQEAHSVVRNHGSVLPVDLDVEDLDRDVAIREYLLPIQQRLEVLLQKVKDTQTLAGSDLMVAANLVYRSLRSHGHVAGLGAVTASLARRFARQSSPAEGGEEPAPTAPGE